MKEKSIVRLGSTQEKDSPIRIPAFFIVRPAQSKRQVPKEELLVSLNLPLDQVNKKAKSSTASFRCGRSTRTSPVTSSIMTKISTRKPETPGRSSKTELCREGIPLAVFIHLEVCHEVHHPGKC